MCARRQMHWLSHDFQLSARKTHEKQLRNSVLFANLIENNRKKYGKNDNYNNNNEQNDNSMSKVKKILLRQHTEVHSVAIYGAENAENRQQSELQPVKE